MKTPQFEVRKVINAYLNGLGYKTSGRPTKGQPVVFIDQLQDIAVDDTKDSKQYQVSFILDCCSVSTSPKESYDILENVRESGIDTLSYTGLIVQEFKYGECTEMVEQTDSDTLWRQIQRIEINFE